MPRPIPLSEGQRDTYDQFYDLADGLFVGFDPRKVWLAEHEYGGIHQVFDVVDGVYLNGVEKHDLDYPEVQVLAAMALINASEFKADESMSPGDRSYDD